MGQDYFIDALISLADGVETEVEGQDPGKVQLSVPVVVSVQGFLLAGYVVSAGDYMKNVAETMVKAKVANADIDAMGVAIGSAKASIDEKTKTSADYDYLHMRDVRVLNFPGGGSGLGQAKVG